MASDFPAAFAALREILRKHTGDLTAHSDTPTDYTVVSVAPGLRKKPLWFGAVLLKKSAVTYHLIPVHDPALSARISPELRKRKQGKTCFNFQRPDAALFAELDELTRIAREHWPPQL